MALFPTLPGTLRTQSRRERMMAWERVGRSHRSLWMTASLVSNAGAFSMVWLGTVLMGNLRLLSAMRPVVAVAITCSAGLLAGYTIFRLFFFRRVERAAEAYFADPEAPSDASLVAVAPEI